MLIVLVSNETALLKHSGIGTCMLIKRLKKQESENVLSERTTYFAYKH